MKITDFLNARKITVQTSAATRDEAIDTLVALQDLDGALNDPIAFKNDILAREAKGTTAIGMGLAVPHAKSQAAARPSLAAITLTKGVDYLAPDGQAADLLFMIATPPGGDTHIEILSRMMVLLMDPDFCQKLRQAPDPGSFLALIDEAEMAKYGSQKDGESKASDEKQAQAESISPVQGEPKAAKVLAVTACPTGIAHTFMAAEALKKAGLKLNIPIRVETNGSTGVQDPLTKEDIEAAEAVIVAADKKVETKRFDGKKVIFVPVADGIHRPEELINQALTGDVAIYRHQAEGDDSKEEKSESFGRGIYKSLMNGVSHMLPFVSGGGVLIALAFLFDDFNINPANFGSNTPLAKVLMTIGGAAFSFMLPILAGYIAMSIADRPALAPGIVGGLLARDGQSFSSLLGSADPVSGGFLAALLAGFLAGYAVLAIKKTTDGFPRSLQGIRPVLLFPLLGVLIVGLVMLSINPLMGVINTALAKGLNSMGSTSRVLLGCLLAGMMSTDMGGPINKAAYVFGTASIAAGNFEVMAAVMIGGMTPPLSIALATTFFKNRFTAEERRSGPVNYIMGLCFITEGAIPYAAADPLKVIPSCLLGSALAGGLSMAFNCGLRAPHGGIFVFPVVTHPVFYLLALALGSILGMFLLFILKKKISS
ncbi:MAG: fructose-specific PTS transporter subunit EIIC [Deltaproteobacteria bacterium]|jgi:PTS system fructose-specific IIC component|nr:fructose-specific PTS transporter subunit EIIC [Deltaproteobacteria bacterium]